MKMWMRTVNPVYKGKKQLLIYKSLFTFPRWFKYKFGSSYLYTNSFDMLVLSQLADSWKSPTPSTTPASSLASSCFLAPGRGRFFSCALLCCLPPDPHRQRFYHLCCVLGSEPPHPHVYPARQLLFLEIWYVTSTVPNMLANFLSDKQLISFSGCFLQFYFFFSLGSTECFLGCYGIWIDTLAICWPLHYPTLMTGRLLVPIL